MAGVGPGVLLQSVPPIYRLAVARPPIQPLVAMS